MVKGKETADWQASLSNYLSNVKKTNTAPVVGTTPGAMSTPPQGGAIGYSPTVTATQPSTTIPTQVLENASPESFNGPGLNAGVSQTAVGVADSYMKDVQTQLDASQKQYDESSSLARQYQNQLLGRSKDYNELVNQAGIPQANRELNQQLARIRLGRDELANANDFLNLRVDQEKWDAADRDVTKGVFSAKESRMRSDQLLANSAKAIKLRSQIADADLLQGNITAALDQVNSALSAKYDPIEQALGYEMFWLGQQKDFLTADKKNLADARLEKLNAQMEEINAARDAVNQAVASGGAQPGEIERMMNMSPQDQMAYANVIQGRVAAGDRARQIESHNMNIRKNLYEMGLMGDPSAIAQLGYDPRETDPEMVAEKEAENAKLDQQAIVADRVIGIVDNALGQADWNSTGLVGWSLQNVGGTDAKNLDSQIATIKANLGFQQLQQMRDASPTGGALGQVSERELRALESTVANLEIGQTREQLVQNLQKVKTHYQNWLNIQGLTVAPDGRVIQIID